MSRRAKERIARWKRSIRRQKENRRRVPKIRCTFRRSGFRGSGGGDIHSTHLSDASGRVTVEAPKTLHFEENMDETLSFFERLGTRASRQRKLFVDLSQIEKVSTGEVIYLLARLDELVVARRWGEITGRSPRDADARQMFEDSGFVQRINRPTAPLSGDFVRVRHGTMADTASAKEITSFVRSKLRLTQDDTRGLYKVLIECMTNTRNHAYAADRLQSKWWLIAFYSRALDAVNFSFLDTGHGIPVTMRKKWREKLTALVPGVGVDSTLIVSGLQGAFRTRTGRHNRGKGLPQIYSVATSDQIASMCILSRTAHIDCQTLQARTMRTPFRGTMYNWTIRAQSPGIIERAAS